MRQHADLIHRFYTSFQHRDAAGMIACYHPDVTFSDPVFPLLEGQHANAMWQMLCENGKDLDIEFRDVSADDHGGQAHWEAHYTLPTTGRKIHNKIDARFDFRDGKIFRHRDHFNFWAWASQALGWKGFLFGWSVAVRNRVRSQAAKRLESFMSRKFRGDR
ncbi:MAG: nuclear transport factor 2 family protein [Pseudomonadota bacterium]